MYAAPAPPPLPAGAQSFLDECISLAGQQLMEIHANNAAPSSSGSDGQAYAVGGRQLLHASPALDAANVAADPGALRQRLLQAVELAWPHAYSKAAGYVKPLLAKWLVSNLPTLANQDIICNWYHICKRRICLLSHHFGRILLY